MAINKERSNLRNEAGRDVPLLPVLFRPTVMDHRSRMQALTRPRLAVTCGSHDGRRQSTPLPQEKEDGGGMYCGSDRNR